MTHVVHVVPAVRKWLAVCLVVSSILDVQVARVDTVAVNGNVYFGPY